MVMRIDCPHCGGSTRIRNSRKLSPTTIEQAFQCLNYECGHTWISFTSPVRTIVPSQRPNPDVHIPLSPRSTSFPNPDGSQLPLAMDSG